MGTSARQEARLRLRYELRAAPRAHSGTHRIGLACGMAEALTAVISEQVAFGSGARQRWPQRVVPSRQGLHSEAFLKPVRVPAACALVASPSSILTSGWHRASDAGKCLPAMTLRLHLSIDYPAAPRYSLAGGANVLLYRSRALCLLVGASTTRNKLQLSGA